MDECFELLSNDVMHPYIAQAFESIGSYSDEISFLKRQQHRENNIIMSIAHSRGFEANLVGVDLNHNKKRVDARSLSGVRQILLHVHWYAFVVIGNS